MPGRHIQAAGAVIRPKAAPRAAGFNGEVADCPLTPVAAVVAAAGRMRARFRELNTLGRGGVEGACNEGSYGILASAGLLLASGAAQAQAQAQALPPMRGDVAAVARVSDVRGPYAAMPPWNMRSRAPMASCAAAMIWRCCRCARSIRSCARPASPPSACRAAGPHLHGRGDRSRRRGRPVGDRCAERTHPALHSCLSHG